MIVYRISRKKYAKDLSGQGAKLVGGRWNSVGLPMLYTSNSIALAMLEITVHLPIGMVPNDYTLIKIDTPDNSITDIKEIGPLPLNWILSTHVVKTRKIGDQFLKECKTLSLRVPSAIVPEEHNLLINPMHPRFKEIKILNTKAIDFDQRLFK